MLVICVCVCIVDWKITFFFSLLFRYKKKKEKRRQRWVRKESRLFGASFAFVCVRDVWLYTYNKNVCVQAAAAAAIIIVVVVSLFICVHFFFIVVSTTTGFGVWTPAVYAVHMSILWSIFDMYNIVFPNEECL